MTDQTPDLTALAAEVLDGLTSAQLAAIQDAAAGLAQLAARHRAAIAAAEDPDETDDDCDPRALRRDLDKVITALTGRGPKATHDAVWAHVGPVLRVLREQLAGTARKVAEVKAERDEARLLARQMTGSLNVARYQRDGAERRHRGLVQGLQIELRAAIKAHGEAEALLREIADPTPCELHPGNNFCQTHAARPPCPHGEAQRHLAAFDRPEGTP